ncbi:hypothetical protein CCMSSC00406_0006079 [Pleurotus cornucopiae]|uniref:Uncharacterized protein n=1 Tax=Pleurotus cornucopiae TaxID=5321 RepID=A0ACB7J9M3_PLECO|nr:hypothetical protein CCMSSC00406_0006079 [Pleurotus cornucopiae]
MYGVQENASYEELCAEPLPCFEFKEPTSLANSIASIHRPYWADCSGFWPPRANVSAFQAYFPPSSVARVKPVSLPHLYETPELQGGFDAGHFTSVRLVKAYFARVEEIRGGRNTNTYYFPNADPCWSSSGSRVATSIGADMPRHPRSHCAFPVWLIHSHDHVAEAPRPASLAVMEDAPASASQSTGSMSTSSSSSSFPSSSFMEVFIRPLNAWNDPDAT